MIDVTATSTEELLALRADLTKVSPLTFADQARAILRAGYIAAYLAGKKNAVPPTTNAEQGAPDPYNPEDDLESDPMDLDVESDDEYDPALDEGDDSDLEDAVSGASDKTDDALIGLGAMMMGGAASAKMLDAWLGTYSAGLNPLYEQGFHAGLTDQGTIEQATWQAETDPATCSDCLALDGMTWVGAEIDAAMPHPGDSQFGGRTACGPNCRCAIEYTVVPTDEAVYSWGGFDDPTVEAFSTADLLKAHSILRLLKYSDDQLRDDHGMWTDGGSQGEAVITLVASAQSHAPAVTSDLRAITAAYGGNLDATVGPRHTLQFVTKTEASTREKMDKLKHMGYSVAEAKTMMRDNLRYTIVADRGNWTRTVEGAVTTLKADGYTPLRATDHWRETEGYAGLHTNWQTPDGQQTFELQFHTQDSLETKELISHPLYEKMRDLEANDAQLQVYRDKIDAAWTSVRADPPPDTSPFLRSVFGRVGKT